MKRFTLAILAAMAVLALGAGVAGAKPAWKKATGASCAECHVDDKKAANPGNKLWKAAKDMEDQTKAGKYGTKSCNDCHQGALKPPK
jgi:mono/diheme cytochrome c family protein